MNLRYAATYKLPQPRGRCDLPQVVKNNPKKCARPPGRPESVWTDNLGFLEGYAKMGPSTFGSKTCARMKLMKSI